MARRPKISAVFFGTDEFAGDVLKRLADAGQFNFRAVITQPDKPVGRKKIFTPPPVKVLAQEKKILVWQPDKLTDEFIKKLAGIKADIFIVAAYGKILPAELIELPKYKTVNLHPSILPKYRGPAPIQTALLNDDKTTGTTLMLIDEKMDHGDIISKSQITISKSDNYITLSKKLAELSAELLINSLPDYISGRIKPQPQDHEQASYTKIIKKENGVITADKTAKQIYNMWRAYVVWPQVYGELTANAKVLNVKLLDIELSDLTEDNRRPLELFAKNKQLYLACAKKTALKVNRLQIQGKQPIDAKNFINGYLR